MSFAGHPIAETPHLDSIAKNGVHFKNAFVTTSLCSPSRASILTGLHTFRHRVIDNNQAVPEGTLFFPQYLQASGYTTGFVGKWHMGAHHDRARPGFDYWVSFKGQGHYRSPSPDYTLNANGRRIKQDRYITDLLTDYALEFLEQQEGGERPFFLYLSHKAVHSNFTPDDRYLGRFARKPVPQFVDQQRQSDSSTDKPRWVRDQRNSWHGVDFPYHSNLSIDELYRRYCESLCSVDDSVGRVLEKLKQMGAYDDTLVIYMGDNGFMFGEHGLIDKRVAYESSMRVPLLVQCPKLYQGGVQVESIVANIDIAPTVLEAMGLEKPSHMDGHSFLRLPGASGMPWRESLLYAYYWEKNYPQTPTMFALRSNRYKLIHYHGVWDTDELFDLDSDPFEQHNLIHDSKYAVVAERMEQELYQTMEGLGGMQAPLNAPRGRSSNKRLGSKGGDRAADFPRSMVIDSSRQALRSGGVGPAQSSGDGDGLPVAQP